MGKASMILNLNAAIATANEAPLFGAGFSSAESDVQVEATEAVTISRLRSRISAGGSGTNNCQLRVNGANGNGLTSMVGTGVNESSLQDVLAAGDDFNLAFTDTGTDPTYSHVRAIVEMASGHGNFYGALGIVVFDVASTTVFLPLGGDLVADGSLVEANVAFRSRAHDIWAALQIRISANARTNTSTVRNRIAGADGAAAITIGAGLTGLFTATGLSDAIADGAAICASLTLGTGVEDLTPGIICATLKSSTGSKSEVWCGNAAGATRTASATPHYMTVGGRFVMTNTDETLRQLPLGYVANVTNLRAYVVANTYTGSCTIKLMVNGVAAITLTIATLATGWQENTTDTVQLSPEDLIDFEIDEGTLLDITITMIGITVQQTQRIVPIVDYHRRRMAA